MSTLREQMINDNVHAAGGPHRHPSMSTLSARPATHPDRHPRWRARHPFPDRSPRISMTHLPAIAFVSIRRLSPWQPTRSRQLRQLTVVATFDIVPSGNITCALLGTPYRYGGTHLLFDRACWHLCGQWAFHTRGLERAGGFLRQPEGFLLEETPGGGGKV
jgi:cell wall-associated NlpC family hydrolase